MKQIIAYIKDHKLENVVLALHKIDGLSGMSVSDIHGFGRGRGRSGPHPRKGIGYKLLTRTRIEIICQDELVESVVSTI